MLLSISHKPKLVLVTLLLVILSIIGCDNSGTDKSQSVASSPTQEGHIDHDALVASFANDFVDSLGWSISASKRTDNVAGLDDEHTLDLMIGLRRAKKDFNMAKTLVDKYTASSNELINKSAKAASLGYEMLIHFDESIIKILEELENLESANKQESVKAGTIMSKSSKILAERDEAWKILATATIGLAHILVSTTPGEKGIYDTLILTSSQRDQLVKKLDSNYGKTIEKGFVAGIKRAYTPGALLREFLTRTDVKTKQ